MDKIKIAKAPFFADEGVQDETDGMELPEARPMHHRFNPFHACEDSRRNSKCPVELRGYRYLKD